MLFIDAETIICNIVFIIVVSIKSFIRIQSRSSLEHVIRKKGKLENFGKNVVFSKKQKKIIEINFSFDLRLSA